MNNHAVSDRTLQKYWRIAVLVTHHNKCIICGFIRSGDELQCHHIIKRRHRVTRHDPKNGVPVCTVECHQKAHTERGRALIRDRLGASHMEYLYERENVLKPDYKKALGFSDKELERYELKKLKDIIGGAE